QAAADRGLEGVLLGLVKAVNLVNKQDGAPTLALSHLGNRYGVAYILDTAKHCGNSNELCIEAIGHQACKRGLAHTRRPPENHGVRPSRLKGNAQRLARAKQVSLAYDFIQRSGTHALSELRMRARAVWQ